MSEDLPPPSSRKRRADHHLDLNDIERLEKDELIGNHELDNDNKKESKEQTSNKRHVGKVENNNNNQSTSPKSNPIDLASLPKPTVSSWGKFEPKFGLTNNSSSSDSNSDASDSTFNFTQTWLKIPSTLPSFLKNENLNATQSSDKKFSPLSFGAYSKNGHSSNPDDGSKEEKNDENQSDLSRTTTVVSLSSGEEDDEVLFSTSSKLSEFQLEERAWKDRGTVTFQINSLKSNPDYARILIRDSIGKLLINYPIHPSFKVNRNEKQPTVITFAASLIEKSEKLVGLATRFGKAEFASNAYKIIQKFIEKKANKKEDDLKNQEDSNRKEEVKDQEKEVSDNKDQEKEVSDNKDQEKKVLDNKDQEKKVLDNKDQEKKVLDNKD